MRLAEAEESSSCCCVGEGVGLDVELHNPLQLDLHLTHLRLACTWDAVTTGMSSATASPEKAAPSSEGSTAPQGFQVSERRSYCNTLWHMGPC